MNRIIYYYQTFTSLKSILDLKPQLVTDIIVSSIHFGKNLDLSPYIHLNDHIPTNTIFDTMWEEIEMANNMGINIHVMVGGAGGAFTDLFENFNIYYEMLKNFIKSKSYIKGINLDVEEETSLENIKMLINKLNEDFGSDFVITMAPVSFALIGDNPGMGGFKYKELIKSDEGKRLNWLNGQFYGNFNLESYNLVIENGYNEEQIVLGMLGNDFDSKLFKSACKEITKIYNCYPNFGGVFVWEYFNSPPDGEKNPANWAVNIKKSLKRSCFMNKIRSQIIKKNNKKNIDIYKYLSINNIKFVKKKNI